ncbi:hypothetical protein [Streptomyces orinoci]|uniref:Integral membrane protein n=1 Tax=Streptomyces orinoci TaxID=67339 RepID=A0ABV3JTW7_STRON|nr:hypothetical protein [Streptomyces orinoci]
MGIESDQLVFDYLSRVGDLAQRTSLTSGERMRLVSRLRTEIERQRAAEGAESPAAVQRILDGLGTPSEAVAGAGGGPAEPAQEPRRVPAQRRGGQGVWFPDAGAPPHLATEEELGGGPREADEWWRVEATQAGPGDRVHGFVGGIEIPDMLRPPRRSPEAGAGVDAAEAADAAAGEPVERLEPDEGTEPLPPARFGLLRSADGAPLSPVLLLVSLLLVTGAVLGNWLVCGAGWALAYVTRRLTENESKGAVLVVPGVVAGGGVLWLWGRSGGHWGAPIPHGQLGPALAETWPVVLRVAAVASALFVLWRARKIG